MVLEIYYLDYKTAVGETHELIYNNKNPSDKILTKTTMNGGFLYNQDGTVGGSAEIISFIREGLKSNTVTSLFSIFTDNGVLNFDIVRKYDDKYDPSNDIVISYSNYSSGNYLVGKPVLMKIEPVGNYPDIAFKISLVY